EAAGDRGLVLRCPPHAPDVLVADSSFSARKIHLAVGRESIAVVAVGAGIGGRRVTCDQVINRERIFDRPQAILNRGGRRAHEVTSWDKRCRANSIACARTETKAPWT